jgi:glyoxylase-like metal-dependent hydrolase (beta-lactamase superfamily II)
MSQPDPPPFEVYAIRYATVERRAAENFIGSDAHETAARMDYFVWLLRNEHHTIVVDTGFDAAAAQQRRRQFLRSPGDGLKLLGVDPATVAEVILTHLHYDHAGNLGLFPAARFHLQDREMAFATGRYMSQEFFSRSYDLDDVLDTVRLVHGRRVLFHDGDGTIVPGVTVHRIGGHTRGLQAVRVWTRVGYLVLASDAAHYTANRVEERPFPIVADVTEMVDGWRRLVELASAPEHVVPGHDPLVMQHYQAPSPQLEGIAVRLDEKPCK